MRLRGLKPGLALAGLLAMVALGTGIALRRAAVVGRVYRIGFENDPPFHFRDADGHPAGFAVDLVNEAARRGGIRLIWVYEPRSSEVALRSGSVDLWPIMTVLERRKAFVHFSAPYRESEGSLVVHAKQPYRSLRDMQGLTVAYNGQPLMQSLFAQHIPGAGLLVRSTPHEILAAMCRGEAAAAYLDEFTAVSALLDGGACAGVKLRVIQTPEMRGLLAIGSTFAAAGAADALRDEITDMASDGTLARISANWSSFTGRSMELNAALLQARRWQRYLGAAVVAAAGVVLLTAWMAWHIRRQGNRARRAAEALRESEERLQSILDNSSTVVFLKDLEGRYIMVNRRYGELFPVTRRTVVGQSDYELFPREHADSYRQHDLLAVEKGGPVEVEELVPQNDGLHTYIIVKFPICRPDGKPYAVCGIATDITKRKRAEQALRESEEKFSRIFNSSTNSVAFTEVEEGRIVEVNDTWVQASGISRANAVGKTALELHLWQESTRNACLAELRGKGRLQDFETELKMKHGVMPVMISAEYVSTGGSRFILWEFRDLSRQKQVEREQEGLRAQLLQAQKMESVGRLAGGVAHDFNNLLTVISGYSRLLLARMPPEHPFRPELEGIHKAGEHAAALTRQLLAFSRRQVLQPRVLVLDRVLEGLLPMLVRLLGEDVEVCVVSRAEAARVSADPNRLEQAVVNLAVNAREAMPGGGKLTIETDVMEWGESQAKLHLGMHAGRYVMLTVSDNGVGMNEETRGKIFEPFFTTKGLMGTGLGLSMVHGTVEQSGGVIEVESEPGRGTSFKIYLPLVEGAEVESGKPAEVSALEGTETVLVVEDQPEVLEYTGAALRTYGYRVIQAKEAAEALQICERERERIDLVLTDVVMPNMSGRELAERLEKVRPGMKVLFMSGYTADVIARHGILEEGMELIEKPFGAEQLVIRIRQMLGEAVKARATVLLADDSAPVREVLTEILREAGYTVVEACDGVQAVERLQEGPVQLALLDAHMPRQGGLDAAREMRRQRPEIKTILMSAAFEGAGGLDLTALGVDGVLPKPVEPEVLLDTLRCLLVVRKNVVRPC